MRVVSFNLNGKLKDKTKRVQIANILKSLNADIICLQEIFNPQHAQWLANKLSLNFNKKAWHKGGMTVFSKYKIQDTINVEIPDSYHNAFIAIKTLNIWVSSIHLSSWEYKRDESERIREIEWILKYFTPTVGIMGGDWNSISHLDLKYQLKNKLLPSHLVGEMGWVDTLENYNKSTWIPADTHNTKERIDRIYVKPSRKWKVVKGYTLDARNFPSLKSWPTGRDHRLVMTDIIKK